jgi:hypothetical protein
MVHINLRTLCVSLVLGSLLALGSFSVVSAQNGPPGVPPVIVGLSHFEIPPFALGHCDSFDIMAEVEGDVTAHRFIDDAGNLWRVILQAQGTDTFFNSVTTAKAYSTRFHEALIINPGLSAVGGLDADQVHLTIPGAGAVLLDVGVHVFIRANDLEITPGQHQILEGDFDALCTALT